MEFNINKETNEQKYETKYFSEYINDISFYNKSKIDKTTFIITQKSVADTLTWIKNNNKSPWQKQETNIYKFIKIWDDVKYEIMFTQNSLWETVKTMLVMYLVKQTRDKSKLSIFNDISKVKCQIIEVVRLKSQEEFKIKLRKIKDKLYDNKHNNEKTSSKKGSIKDINKKTNDNIDIFSMYLNIVKEKYSQKIKYNYCYIYLYYNYNDEKEIIVFPEEIKTIEDMKLIVETLYLRNIDVKKKFKLIDKEKYQYLIETLILLDKYSDKYSTQKLNIFVTNNNIKLIQKTIDSIGYNTYDRIQDFSKLLQKINCDIPIVMTERKKRTKPVKKIQAIKTTPKTKKYDDNNSTIVSDSEDDEPKRKLITKKPTKIIKQTIHDNQKTDKKVLIQDKINKSIGDFLKNHIKRKKDTFITIKMIYDTYKKSSELKQIKIDTNMITRAMIRKYLSNYKWFNDNYKEKHKDIRSVVMNYTLI